MVLHYAGYFNQLAVRSDLFYQVGRYSIGRQRRQTELENKYMVYAVFDRYHCRWHLLLRRIRSGKHADESAGIYGSRGRNQGGHYSGSQILLSALCIPAILYYCSICTDGVADAV